jgi:MFS family permease
MALAIAAAALAFALMLRPSRAGREATDAAAPIPIAVLLRTPGLYALLMLSVFSVTAGDLIVIYLPLLGTERHIDVEDIGMVLTLRAIAAIVARLIYSRLVAVTGRLPLMIAGTLAAVLAFVALALPVPLIVLGLGNAVVGFALGLTTTLTLTGTLMLVPAGARGTANSLRLVGNRIGQLVLPIGAGAVAAVTGVGGIFALLALALAASAAAIYRHPAAAQP